MSHPDAELLAALVVGDPVPDDVRDHVATCRACRDEVEALRTVSGSLREPLPELVPPPASLRDSVLAAARSADAPGGATDASEPHAPPEDELAARRRDAAAAPDAPAGRSGRRFGAGWLVGAAAAGLVLGGAGAAAVGALRPDEPQVTVVAQADLDTLDTGARLGVADLVEHNGTTDLALHTESMSAGDGYLEVWLINRDGERMVSIGVLEPGRTDQVFAVPASLVTQGYVVVDISREPFDSDARHSGDSLARGTLPV